jgi:hypothetical protein
VHELRDAYKNTTQPDGAASIRFPEIAVELGIPEREVLRWTRARSRGKTFRSSADYRAYAIEVERRHRLIDYSLYSSDDLYRDGIFKNARGAVA